MSTGRKGPSTAARENLGALYPVLEVEIVDNRRVLTLDCPGKHRVHSANARSDPDPKKGRCKLCPRPICGATNRDGDACELPPKHARITGPWHEHGAKRWTYDMRVPAESKAS